MATTIGEVNINLRMSLAQFKQDTRDGTKAAGDAAKEMGSAVSGGSQEAKASLALIGEEIGVNIPRHIRGFISSVPAIGSALSAAFSAVAIVAVIEVIVKAIEKTQELAKEVGGFGKEAEAAYAKLVEGNKQALKFAEDLAKKYRELALIGLSGGALDAKKRELDTVELTLAQQKLNDGLKREQEIRAQIEAETNARRTDPGTMIQSLVTDKTGITDNPVPRLKKELEELQAENEKVAQSIRTTNWKADSDAKTADADATKRVAEETKKLNELLVKAWDQAVKVQTIASSIKIPDIIGDAFSAVKLKPPPSFEELFGGARDKQNEAVLKDAQKVYDETRTHAEKYADELEHLNALLANGNITQDTYNRAVTLAKSKFDDVTIAARQFGVDIADTLKQGSLWGSNWKSVLQTLGIELAELILKMTVLKNLQQTAAASGAGGFFSSLLSGFGGFKAAGGPLESNKWYVAGEHGPEPVWGGGSGAFATGYGKTMDGGNQTINVQMDVHGVSDVDSFRKSQSQVATELADALARAQRRYR